MLSLEARIAYDLSLILSALFLLCLRFVVRYYLARPSSPTTSWILSDIFGAVAWVICASAIALDVYLQVRRFRARDDIAEQLRVAVLFRQVVMYYSFVQLSVLWGVKASFLATFWTAGEHMSTGVRRGLVLASWLLAGSYVGLIGAQLFWCWPIQRNWSIGPDFCSGSVSVHKTIIFYSLAYITDVPVIAIPFFLFRPKRGDRCAMGFVYSIGLLSIVFATITFALQLQTKSRFTSNSLRQIEENLEHIYLFSGMEMWAACALMCLPSLRLLARHRRTGRWNTHTTRRGGAGDGYMRTEASTDLLKPTRMQSFRAVVGRTGILKTTRMEVRVESVCGSSVGDEMQMQAQRPQSIGVAR